MHLFTIIDTHTLPNGPVPLKLAPCLRKWHQTQKCDILGKPLEMPWGVQVLYECQYGELWDPWPFARSRTTDHDDCPQLGPEHQDWTRGLGLGDSSLGWPSATRSTSGWSQENFLLLEWRNDLVLRGYFQRCLFMFPLWMLTSKCKVSSFSKKIVQHRSDYTTITG